MSIRRALTVTRVGTKAGLTVGTAYLYYETGLWKDTDQTIENYDKFKKDVKSCYESTPPEVQKWGEYVSSTVQSNVEPYKRSVSDFRKNWLNFDFSYLTEEGDGIIKPTWNKGVAWTVEAIKDSPQTVKKWSKAGWDKVNELGQGQGGEGSGGGSQQLAKPMI